MQYKFWMTKCYLIDSKSNLGSGFKSFYISYLLLKKKKKKKFLEEETQVNL